MPLPVITGDQTNLLLTLVSVCTLQRHYKAITQMPNNLFISYDLKKEDDAALTEHLKSLGIWARIHNRFWFLSSKLSAQQVEKRLRDYIGPDDSLVVIDSTNNDAFWFGVTKEVSEYLKANWQH